MRPETERTTLEKLHIIQEQEMCEVHGVLWLTSVPNGQRASDVMSLTLCHCVHTYVCVYGVCVCGWFKYFSLACNVFGVWSVLCISVSAVCCACACMLCTVSVLVLYVRAWFRRGVLVVCAVCVLVCIMCMCGMWCALVCGVLCVHVCLWCVQVQHSLVFAQ